MLVHRQRRLLKLDKKEKANDSSAVQSNLGNRLKGTFISKLQHKGAVMEDSPPPPLYFKLFQKLKVPKLESQITKPSDDALELKEGQIAKHGDKLRRVVKRKKQPSNNVGIVGVSRKLKACPENI